MALHTWRSPSTKKQNLMQKGYHKKHQLVVLTWETQVSQNTSAAEKSWEYGKALHPMHRRGNEL